MKKILIGISFAVLIMVICGLLVFLYRKSQFERILGIQSNTDSSSITIKKLGEHILLPTSTPSIGTVVDVEKLREKSAFFKDAKNGDKVVIYSDKAIIFDEKLNKIINVGMIPKVSKQPTVSSGSAEMLK